MSTVPTLTLDQIYSETAVQEQRDRYARLTTAFREQFGAAPEVIARAPGRVNLIGEHIDYSGYAVLPMAIVQDTVVLVRKSGGSRITLKNSDAKKYPDFQLSTDPAQKVDEQNHSWGNYFAAAYKGVFEHLAAAGVAQPEVTGLEVLVDGRVPQGSGLSSSAAFVVASAAAVLGVYGQSVSQGDVATFTAKCEKYVGTESGGMDQAISVMAKKGLASVVSFNPVRVADVPLPPGAAFVLANSLTVSAKAVDAVFHYNLRVVECRLAAILLALALGAPKEKALGLHTLREVEGLLGEGDSGGAPLQAAAEAARAHLHEGPYSREEAEALLGTPLAEVFKSNAIQLRSVEHGAAHGGFELRKRALHVFSEAARVPAFQAECGGPAPQADKLAALGRLMDESQASCRDLYECSCPELDELVKVSKAAGALGARLTGAGWGGCTVALVRAGDAARYVREVTERFFAARVARGLVSSGGLADVIFASLPGSGAALVRL